MDWNISLMIIDIYHRHFSVINSPHSGLIWRALVHANSPSMKYNPCILLLIISFCGLHINYLYHQAIIFLLVSYSLNGSCLGYGKWNQGVVKKTELYDLNLHYNSYFHSQQIAVNKNTFRFFRFILDSSFPKTFFLAAFAHKQQPVDPQRWVGLTLTLGLTC